MVEIELIREYGEPLPFEPSELFQRVAEAVMYSENCPFDTEISVSLVDDQEIRLRNSLYRKIDLATDVLSFPLVPFPSPADFRFLEEGEEQDCFDPDTGELCLGDIVINTARVRSQAEEYGHSLRRETAFLTAHSTLHLLGYDHMTEQEAAVMENRQEAVLQELGITRDAEFPEEKNV